jgi:hypothetical protein
MKKQNCACKHHICSYCTKVVEAKGGSGKQDAAKSWWEKLKEWGVPKDFAPFSGQSPKPIHAWF